MSWEVEKEKRKRARDEGKGKEKKTDFKPPIFITAFFTGIANRSPFGEERGILLIVASTGIRRLVPGVFHKEYQYGPSYNELSRKWRIFSMQYLKCQQRLNF